MPKKECKENEEIEEKIILKVENIAEISKCDESLKLANNTNILLNVWSCECGKENENEWTICQKCKKIKQGLSGWVCFNCTFHNQNIYNMCRGCGLSDPNCDKWQCKKCYKFYQINTQQCLSCKTYNTNVSSEMKNKLEKAQTNDVVESKEVNNFNCNSTKEEKMNNLVESKEEEKVKSLSENKIWKCESCKNSTSIAKSKCDFCDLPKWSSKESWVCSHCKKLNKFALGSCLYCNKKCLKVIKVRCEKCKILVYSPEVLCEKCKKQNSSSELFWECQSCNKKNENNLLGCKYCFKEKTQNTQSLENKNSSNILENMDSKPKCSICMKEISLLFCKSCVRAVLYGEKCTYCKKHLIDLTTCYTCFNKSGLSQKSPYFFKPNS